LNFGSPNATTNMTVFGYSHSPAVNRKPPNINRMSRGCRKQVASKKQEMTPMPISLSFHIPVQDVASLVAQMLQSPTRSPYPPIVRSPAITERALQPLAQLEDQESNAGPSLLCSSLTEPPAPAELQTYVSRTLFRAVCSIEAASMLPSCPSWDVISRSAKPFSSYHFCLRSHASR